MLKDRPSWRIFTEVQGVQACNLGIPILAEELENRQRFK
jgi:hypothetical protein